MKRSILYSLMLIFGIVLLMVPNISCTRVQEELLKGSYREEKAGWIYVHIEGNPYQLGYQNGYLLADEIYNEVLPNVKFFVEKYVKPWSSFRDVVAEIHWPKTHEEYKTEIKGIVDGIKAKGYTDVDYLDICALNNWLQIAWYYFPWKDQQDNPSTKEKCSAFIATGDATKDGKIVIAHNTWLDYIYGLHWNVILHIKPEKGYEIMSQTCPGFIHSGPDWTMNSAGLMICETTMCGFSGFDPEGIPEAMRLRKATQYSNSIDEWIAIMVEGRNGEYPNDWLIGDRKTGEIARLELALINYKVWRTSNGYYVGSNIALDPKVREEETEFPYDDPSTSPYSRRVRWLELMKKHYGKIDVELAKKLIADHYDTYRKRDQPSAKTICGHVEVDPGGMPGFGWGPNSPAGTIDGKVTDSEHNLKMQMWVRWGHPCGTDYYAKPHLDKFPDYKEQEPQLRDMPGNPWVLFTAKK